MLGSWPAEFFIVETVKLLRHTVLGRKALFLDAKENVKRSLLRVFQTPGLDISYRAGLDHDTFDLSSKAQCLVTFLAEQPPGATTAIVFVQRRVVTAVLCHLLSTHPMTKDRFRCAPFVGSSNIPSRKHSLGELLDLPAQKGILEEFRSGNINLLVATNALEEGIDVQSCNLVVCFDPPSNLKSFIQRRGRARQEKSTLAIMASTEDDTWKVEKWQALEAELVRICQSDRDAAEALDAGLGDEDETIDFKLVHPKT
ncbi:Dicer-like protein 2, partial [Elasticomyces elasticus]